MKLNTYNIEKIVMSNANNNMLSRLINLVVNSIFKYLI